MQRTTSYARLLTLSCVAVVFSTLGAAGEGRDATDTDTYIVTIGGFGTLEPRFEGARRSRWGFQPLFDIRKSSERDWLSLPRDGVSFSLIEISNFRAGLVGNGRWGRDTDSMIRGFRRISSIYLSVEAGAFAEFWPTEYLRTRIEAREALIGAEGLVADMTADLVLRPLPKLTWTAGPRWSIADQAFMSSYYGLSSVQSTRSGLPAYSLNAGTRTVGAGSMLKYNLDPSMALIGYVEYQRISDNAARSPLISQRGMACPPETSPGLGFESGYFQALRWRQGHGTERQVDRRDHRGTPRS